MESKEFRIWLQGFFDGVGSEKLTKEQVDQIKMKLQTVFTKVTTQSKPHPFGKHFY